jgi:SAM-dependent MidA family methyltransferase
MNRPLVDYLRQSIRGRGPITFRDFMDAVLYHPDFGYYSSERNPIGRQGDFYTSSDLDPVFGKILAERFFSMATELGVSPESFTIVELGAGRGWLARDILQHIRFPYCILERSSKMRRRQQESLGGFDVQWLDDLPVDLTGCVFSNEFFDALPVHRVVNRDGRLREIYVTEDFTEVEGDLQTAVDAPLAEGQLADISLDGPHWVQRIAASLRRGYHVAIDYGYLSREFYARPAGTLMCYWQHQIVADPYVRIGEQDITAHVNFSDLIAAGDASGLETIAFSNQMDFLIERGILKELEVLARSPRSEDIQRLLAIKKLLLPDGMGERFKVLIQRKLN